MELTRLHRVLRLLTLLQSGEPLTVAELMAELNVSRRTVFRDLDALRDAGVPCFHESGRGYRIAPGFFLPPVNLTVAEALGLMTLAKAASAQREQPFSGPVVEAVRKLVAMIPPPIREACQGIMTNVSVRPAPAASPNGARNYHALLQQAIDERRVVALDYTSVFQGEGRIRLHLHPYHLHFAARAWYVIGYSEKHRQVRTFKLSRIESLDLLERRFRSDNGFDIDRHLGKAWQLIPEGRVYRVELLFTPKVATNVCEVRWHATQKHRTLDDGSCLMTFEIDGLNEISWWLLGYGDQVVVRKPAALRKLVAKRHRAALERYRDTQPAGEATA